MVSRSLSTFVVTDMFHIILLATFHSPSMLMTAVNAIDHRIPFGIFHDTLLEETVLDDLFNPWTVTQDDPTNAAVILDPSFTNFKDITLELYTRNNTETPILLKLEDANLLKHSTFDSQRETKLIIHGWIDNANACWVRDMRRIYLNTGDYNVIAVDWFPGSAKEYFIAARLTRQVGMYLSNFLKFLQREADLSLDDVHILGHSLGAHVAGYAGQETSGTIGRITGLDAARPGFEMPQLNDANDRLDSTDAKFVDVIHTCAGILGFILPIGHADFYPNGGTYRQPGCPIFSTQGCSHGRSHEYMIESIISTQTFIAVKCDSWSNFKSGQCKDNQKTRMGETINANTRGLFFLETNPLPPFGKGDYEMI